VSNDLKTTLTNEIGLEEFQRDIDSIRNTPLIPRASTSAPANSMPQPMVDLLDRPLPSPAAASTSAAAEGTTSLTSTAEAVSKTVSLDNGDLRAQGEDLERMRQESARMAWGNVPSELSSDDTPRTSPPAKKKALEEMSMVELEAELAKRKKLIAELSGNS